MGQCSSEPDQSRSDLDLARHAHLGKNAPHLTAHRSDADLPPGGNGDCGAAERELGGDFGLGERQPKAKLRR